MTLVRALTRRRLGQRQPTAASCHARLSTEAACGLDRDRDRCSNPALASDPRRRRLRSAQQAALSACWGQVPSAGFLGDADGDGTDQRSGGDEDGDPEQSVACGGPCDEGGGDEWGEAAADGGGQLVAQ